MMASPNAFLISSKLWFSGLLGWRGLKGKKWRKMTKISVSLRISGTLPHMIVVFGTHV